MEPQVEVAPVRSKNVVAIVVASVLIAALAVGGGVYAYQKNKSDKAQLSLQNQITSLQQQIAASKAAVATPTPTPTPVATASPMPSATPTAVPTSVPLLSTNQLMNFTYTDLNGKSHTLSNGTANYTVMGSGGTISILQDIGPQNIDLNGDGVLDSVLVLGENDGGTGYFYQLAAVLNKNGQPVLADEHLILDDRATVKNLTINDGVITVSGLVSGVGQPSSDTGNTPKTELYKFIGGKLTPQ